MPPAGLPSFLHTLVFRYTAAGVGDCPGCSAFDYLLSSICDTRGRLFNLLLVRASSRTSILYVKSIGDWEEVNDRIVGKY
jgi:hypothetical protein